MNRILARAAIIAALLVSSLTITAPSTMAASVNTADPCYDDNSWFIRGIGKNTGVAVVEIQANILVRNVWNCWDPYSFNGGSYVLPVNIENGTKLIQLGYGRDETTTGGAQKWVYTPDTCSGGVADDVPSWPAPIDGHTYRLTIKWVPSSNRWRGYMDDHIDGLGNPIGVWYNDGECFTYGHTVWAGFETHDRGDMMGGSLWTPITTVDYFTNNASYSLWEGDNFTIGSPWASQWHTQVYNDPSVFDAIRAYTS